MMYKLSVCIVANVCVISLLLDPAVNASSCLSLTRSMSSVSANWLHWNTLTFLHSLLILITSCCSCLSCHRRVSILKFSCPVWKRSLPGEFCNNGNLDTDRTDLLLKPFLWWLSELIKEYFIWFMFCLFCPRRHTNRNSMFWMTGCGINKSCSLLQFKCCKIIRTALFFSVDFFQNVMPFYTTGHRILWRAKHTVVVLRKRLIIIGLSLLFSVI